MDDPGADSRMAVGHPREVQRVGHSVDAVEEQADGEHVRDGVVRDTGRPYRVEVGPGQVAVGVELVQQRQGGAQLGWTASGSEGSIDPLDSTRVVSPCALAQNGHSLRRET